MLLLALILVLLGCVIAVAVDRTIGLLVAAAGVIVLIVALVDVDSADALVTAGRSWSG